MSFSINWDTDSYNRAMECLKEKEKNASTSLYHPMSAMYNPETGYVTLGNDDKVSDEQLANTPMWINGQNHPIYLNTNTSSGTGSFRYTTETSSGATTSQPMMRGPSRTATYDTPGITWYTDNTLDRGVVYCWDTGENCHIKFDPKEEAKKQKQIEKAKKKSFQLLKQWLSKAEYNYLMEEGNLELPSQHEKDTIYIVNKDPMRRIGIKKRGKVIEKSLCIHASHAYADGDVLLSNILLLKTDEKKFLEIANVHDFYA